MEKSFPHPKAIPFGTKIQLRNEVHKKLKLREWEFAGIEKGKIVLMGRGGLILDATIDDIDWESHGKSKIED